MKKLKLSGKEMLTKQQLKVISGGYLHADCACLNDAWCPPSPIYGYPDQCSNPNLFACRNIDINGWGMCDNF